MMPKFSSRLASRFVGISLFAFIIFFSVGLYPSSSSNVARAQDIPAWCDEDDEECKEAREPACWGRGIFNRSSYDKCLLGTKPDEDTGGQSSQSSTSGSSQSSSSSSSRDRRRADRVTDRRGGEPLLNPTEQARLEQCIDAILLGPGQKKIRIKGHEFNCKPPRAFSRLGNLWIFEGQLSHHLSIRSDDQVNYSFSLAPDGSIEDFKVNIRRGGMFATINRVAPLTRINRRLDPGYWTASTFSRLAGHAFEGSWEDVASMILINASNRLSRSVAEARRNLPRSSDSDFYYVDIPGNDIRRIDLTGDNATPNMCRRQCAYENKCEAWTFHRPNLNNRDARCWLKDSAPPTRILRGVVSGRKGRQTVRPR